MLCVSAAVKESLERVITALSNSGYNFNYGRTTSKLAPADV
jgi:predicted ATPase with chaperone activity